MARRLCRLPRLLPLAAPASAAASKPHPRLLPLAANPSPATLFVAPYARPPPSSPLLPRLFSSSAGGSIMVVIGSAETFSSVLSKVRDEKLPAVFYYTAVWCGPCRAMAPVISKLSSQYPHIPVYKVDIDMEGIGSKLTDLKICSVPTFHFYLKGEKTGQVVGANVKQLEIAMDALHKQQQEFQRRG